MWLFRFYSKFHRSYGACAVPVFARHERGGSRVGYEHRLDHLLSFTFATFQLLWDNFTVMRGGVFSFPAPFLFFRAFRKASRAYGTEKGLYLLIGWVCYGRNWCGAYRLMGGERWRWMGISVFRISTGCDSSDRPLFGCAGRQRGRNVPASNGLFRRVTPGDFLILSPHCLSPSLIAIYLWSALLHQ